MKNLKDSLTTIAALVTVVGTAVNAYLQSNAGEINWYQLGTGVVIALVAYFTGKKADGGTKSIA